MSKDGDGTPGPGNVNTPAPPKQTPGQKSGGKG